MNGFLDFEGYLLGHCLDENAHFLEAAQLLRSEDLSLPANQTIFRAIAQVLASGKSANIVTVGEFLQRHALVESVGGFSYLTSLTNGLVRGRQSVRDYAQLVKEASQRRRVVQLGEQLSNEGMLTSTNVDQLISQAETGLLEIRSEANRGNPSAIAGSVVPLMDRLHRERSRNNSLLGLPCGIDSLDVMTRGMQPGEITVVGARSGVGKSSLMTQAAIANCRRGVPVMLISVEMSREQNLRRILSVIAGVPFPRVRDPKHASDTDMEALRLASETVAEWPLHIVDDSSITIEKLNATARLAIRRDGVKLLCVDYAQIVAAAGRDERLRVAAVSRGLTRLAKDEGIPVMVLSQLSRADRSSPNRRPTMSDLRESSQLENDAHSILLLHRDWDGAEGRLSSDGELIVAKQRSGDTGILPVTFNRCSLLFEKRTLDKEQSRTNLSWMESREAMELHA
jgi:replicative DNA helicase